MQVMQTYGKDVRIAFKQLPAAVPQQRARGGRSGAGGQGPGQVLGDARHHVQEPAGARSRRRSRSTRRRSASTSTSSRATSTRASGRRRSTPSRPRATKLGARGTPSFFINGKSLRRRAAARRLQGQDRRRDQRSRRQGARQLRQVLRRAHEGREDGSARRLRPRRAPPSDTQVYKVDPGNGPSVGPKNGAGARSSSSRTSSARSARASSRPSSRSRTSTRTRSASRGATIRCRSTTTRWRAAEAAMAANAQGKFWPMHDKLFANQQAARSPEPREVRQ